MKRVGICACYDTLNYGSMLQSFATQHVINNLGFDSEFIVYKKKKDFDFIIKCLPKLIDKTFISDKLQILQKKTALQFHPEVRKNNSIRNNAFRRFQKDFYGKFSEEFHGYKELVKGADRYDIVVVGSDQLWLPAGLSTNFYNLMFVPEHIKKVSYATSFGVSEIPKRQFLKTKEYLSRIEHISVREKTGAKIVESVSGKKAEVVADPTLLLTKSEWDKLIPDRKIVDKPYIFCYFLGDNPSHRMVAEEFSEKIGLPIVCTPFLDKYVKIDENFGGIQLFDVGPDNFVNLIRHAEFILTDSFHGSVFSIINHKQFVTFNRFSDNNQNSRNSRIDNLCELLGINGRRYVENIVSTAKAEINYREVDARVASLRLQSINFLNKAMND